MALHVRYVTGRESTSRSWGKSGVKKVTRRSIPSALKSYFVCKGVTSTAVCFIASTAGRRNPRAAAPIQRNVRPSMRTSPVIGCAASDQCFVGESFRLSLIDQRLKYGSFTARGTAGGRCCWPRAGAINATAIKQEVSEDLRQRDMKYPLYIYFVND